MIGDWTNHQSPITNYQKMLYEQIEEAVEYIRDITDFQPRFGIVLGTGLSGLVDVMEKVEVIEYEDIPHFLSPTVETHRGKLILGHFGGQPVVVMAGRFHYYEGYSMKEVTFPIRVLKFLGIERLVISNISGSTNAKIFPGDLVFIKDHINLQPENPLRGINDERLGPRFPEMLRTYDRVLNQKALDFAMENNIKAQEGVYVALPGPNLETPAEYGFLHTIGGDVVGMSTVPEVIVARHMDLPLFVVSVVSNKCFPIENIPSSSVEEIIEIAIEAGAKMQQVVEYVLNEESSLVMRD